MDRQISNDEFQKGILAIGAAIAGILIFPMALHLYLTWKSDRRPRISIQKIALVLLLVGGAFALWLAWLDPSPLYEVDWLRGRRFGRKPIYLNLIGARLVWLWSVSGLIALLISPFIFRFRKSSTELRTRHFGGTKPNSREIRHCFENLEQMPIGIDVQTDLPVSLAIHQRTAHMLVIGATGTGKTTLMTNMIVHAIRHGQPCVIVDPKGEDSTLQEIRTLGGRLSSDFDSRFKLFTMSKPELSCQYNPLKHGNANQLKDRIMEALTWSETYYQNVAGSFLTVLTAVTETLGIRLTLDRVSKILNFKEEQAALLKALRTRFDHGDNRSLELYQSLQQYFSKSKESDLAGLSAQITILNNPTFGRLLSFDSSDNEIDLRVVRKNQGIAYFQLDTLGNGDSARRLGRMIVEDLKSLSSEIYKTEPDINARPFFPVFIDEFGSFASSEFIEFLKQTRGSRFGNHLFCQGLEDLDVVSPEFRRQVISNTMTKIALRVDDNETVNEFCATAGTIDAIEQSYQVSGNLIAQKTGMGNLRETKQMRIEHDVLKNLKIGQAVVIQKSPSQVSGIEIYRACDLMGC